jgi:hypothetical protein
MCSLPVESARMRGHASHPNVKAQSSVLSYPTKEKNPARLKK